ncbi:MAG TPA: alpha/beta fold hydrolase [Pseudonocardiaceae bacterium]|nr:alpha/beta fold hydrolase [Pseudonocardiaceae bacterium]
MTTLFCLPHAGGGISAYAGWSAEAPAEVDVRPVRLPGRDGTDGAACHRMTDLIAALVDTVPDAGTSFALLGHSLGAVVAFQLANALAERGNGPHMLFVSGSPAPAKVARPDTRVGDLPDEEFLTAIGRLGGSPPELLDEPENAAALLPRLRADFAVAETYEYLPGTTVSCPISAFAGSDDPQVGAAELDEWRDYSTAWFRRRLLPGDHFYLTTARPLLLRAIGKDLRR